MGHMLYGSTPTVVEFDDRTLAHVELVTLAKLRRNESFAVTIDAPDGGRSTFWLNASSPLEFHFDVGRHEINRQWLELIVDSANSAGGMRIVAEPTKPEGDSPK